MILRFTCGHVTLDVQGSVVYPSGAYSQRLNAYSVRSLDGARSSYNLGPTLGIIEIYIKGVSTAHKQSLDAFLNTSIGLMDYAFSIAQLTNNSVAFPSGSGVDLGKGLGVTVSDVYFTMDNTKGIFTPVPPGSWDINLTGLEYIK